MSLNQGKYKPSIAAIDEVDDLNLKANDVQKQPNDGSETAPLTINQHKLNLDDNLAGKDIFEVKVKEARTPSAGTTNSNGNGSMPGLRGRLQPVDALMRLSRRRRIMYITTACLCALLLVLIIMLIAFWPNTPAYWREGVCLDKECVEAGRQLLLWANVSKDICHNTYEWACGRFAEEYADNDFFVIKRGEWNFKTFNEYQELNELNRFISMLPSTGGSNPIESMITSLYRSCQEIESLTKSQSEMIMKKAINLIGYWHGSRDQFQTYKFQTFLTMLQVTFGVFPFFKVSVTNRLSDEREYIIAIDEGEIGLPHKYFYNIDRNDEIVRQYKLLLRDFAINMGIVSSDAERFADDIFHYEKRIVNHLDLHRSSSEEQRNKEISLRELKNIAHSLPIQETIAAMFSHTVINEDTVVLVRNIEILAQMSAVVSSSDKKSLNDFLVWSLVRHLLPYLSVEYRSLIEKFDDSIYGDSGDERTAKYPRWMVCSKIVRDWLPFAIDALQEKRKIAIESRRLKERKFPNKTFASDEVLRLMFHTLKNELKSTLKQADWIEEDVKKFIGKKLTEMRLQIGIPIEVFPNTSYVRDYYNELLLQNLYFVDHLESIWSFRKSRMVEKLKTMGIVETIISELYTREDIPPVAYCTALNMLIISRSIEVSNYYNYKYPIAVNFARIGADVLEVLIESIPTFVAQYNDGINSSKYTLPKVDVDCVVSDDAERSDLDALPETTLDSFGTTLSAAKIAARALSSFLRAIDSSSPIDGASITPNINYVNLQLTERQRTPGLRSYNENELFTLAYMQKHCSTPIADKQYSRIKPYVEQRLAERYLFNATWNHIQFLKLASSCSVSETKCSNIL